MVAECERKLSGSFSTTHPRRPKDAGTIGLPIYVIKFPDRIIFTPQTYLWLDEFVDCPYFVDKKQIHVTMERMALQLMMFAGDITKYGLARAMSQADEKKSQ